MAVVINKEPPVYFDLIYEGVNNKSFQKRMITLGYITQLHLEEEDIERYRELLDKLPPGSRQQEVMAAYEPCFVSCLPVIAKSVYGHPDSSNVTAVERARGRALKKLEIADPEDPIVKAFKKQETFMHGPGAKSCWTSSEFALAYGIYRRETAQNAYIRNLAIDVYKSDTEEDRTNIASHINRMRNKFKNPADLEAITGPGRHQHYFRWRNPALQVA